MRQEAFCQALSLPQQTGSFLHLNVEEKQFTVGDTSTAD